MPHEIMLAQYEELKQEVKQTLNDGHDEIRTEAYRAFLKLHLHVKSYYLKNEKMRRRLSWYLRPDRRSNQVMEGNNGHLNKIFARYGRGRRDFRKWLLCQKDIEHETALRMTQRDTFGEFAAVNMDSIRKNRIMCSLVSQHARGALDDKAFFNAVFTRI